MGTILVTRDTAVKNTEKQVRQFQTIASATKTTHIVMKLKAKRKKKHKKTTQQIFFLMMGSDFLDWMDRQDITEEVTFEDLNNRDSLV